MADVYYEALWNEAMDDIASIKKSEVVFQKTKVHKNKSEAFKTLANFYIKYVTIINKLGDCFDELIQPQERILIRKILEACIGRLLEIKNQLVELENSDFSYFDKLLMENKMTIYDLDIQIPKYFREERNFELSSLATAIEEITGEQTAENYEEVTNYEEEIPELAGSKADIFDETNMSLRRTDLFESATSQTRFKDNFVSSVSLVEKSNDTNHSMPEELKRKEYQKAILLIQKHERARVGRLQTQLMKEFIRLKDDIAWLRHQPIPQEIQVKVSEVVRRYWSRFLNRRRLKNRAISRNLIMGILEPSWREKFKDLDVQYEESRGYDKSAALEAMEDAILMAKIRLERDYKERYYDDIGDELRYWIKNWYYSMKADGHAMLPDWPNPTPIVPTGAILGIPSDYPVKFVTKILPDAYTTFVTNEAVQAIGGSALIVAGHWISQRQYYMLYKAWRSLKKKPSDKKQKPPTKLDLKRKQKEEMELEKQKIAELKLLGLVPLKSKFFPELGLRDAEYQTSWKNRNFTRDINNALLTEQFAADLQLEVRAAVDEVMASELEKLQAAINSDKGIKTKKKKKKKGERKKHSDSKKPKKDITGNKSKNELIQGMAKRGMIVNYEPKMVSEIMGEHSLINEELRDVYIQDPPPQWGDFRQIVKEFCILPLASRAVHMSSPLIRSVLICGPDSITEEYIRAICTESGAVKFVVDPLIHCKAYKKKMMEHLLNKVPRLLQPAVIFVPNIEKIYFKKAPKIEKGAPNPKVLQKILKKVIKKIKPEDQVLVVGTSSKPWESKPKKVNKIFDKILAMPNIDHQTLSKFWAEKLAKYHAVDRYFNSTALASSTIGYEIDDLKERIEKTMTADRIIKLSVDPLYAGEFFLDSEQPEKKPDCWEWCKSNVKMYKTRKAQIEQRALKEEIPELPEFPDTGGKAKTVLREKKMVINYKNIYHVKDRSNVQCMPFMTEAEKLLDEDYQIEMKRRTKRISKFKVKSNLRRNEKSLEEFPVHKPVNF